MAREIYVLGCDESAGPAEAAEALDTWTAKLGKLGVGSLTEAAPVIHHRKGSPYAEVADAIAESCGAQAIYELEDTPYWHVPFKNQLEIAVCLGAISRRTPVEGDVPARYQQRIIVADRELADDFMRLNPSGMFAEVGNIHAGDPSYAYIYRIVSPDPKSGHR